MRQATPNPLPGPTTAFGAPAAGLPPPIGAKSVGVSQGNDRATASKSLKIRASNLKVARSSGVSITQELFVRTLRSPLTGPAMASRARFTRNSRQRSFRNIAMTSAKRANLATSKLVTAPNTPFAKSANRAFVAPISPNKMHSDEIDIRYVCTEWAKQRSFVLQLKGRKRHTIIFNSLF